MDFTVEPGQGVGPLKFGVTRDAVRKVLGQPDKSILQNKFADSPMDVYNDLGIQTHFDKDDQLEFVNFSGPTPVTYQSEDLLKVEEPETWVDGKDENPEIDPPAFTANSVNVTFYAPANKVEAVGVFKPGYYEGV